MRTLAVGDIHGCSEAFSHLLEAVQLHPADKLITLGDYVDKGPNTKGVLDSLLNLYENHQLIPLKGNHEIMMLEARQGGEPKNVWLNMGGKETLVSYDQPGEINKLDNVSEFHWNFIKHYCLDWVETDTHIFVHANADPYIPLAKQSEHELFWRKFCLRDPHYSGKTIICGHTSQKDGQPINLGHRICIDTWACGKGWLTCLDVDTGKIWQTNQQGQIKISSIEDFQVDTLRTSAAMQPPVEGS